MNEILQKVIIDTVKITLLVMVMMIVVDIINVWTRGKIGEFLKRGKQWKQYVTASLIGAVPGCVGAFTNVSLYIHGLISFGALAGAMVAVSGDEAFIMIAMFPKTALILFGLLSVIGIAAGWFIDLFIKKWKIATCQNCPHELIHPSEHGLSHYLKEHVWKHIIKRHLWRTALWTFGALLIVEIGLHYWHIETFASDYVLPLILLSAIVGLIPESGPHLIFITLYAKGLIPFSVLLTSSMVQDGHGMLPMLAYSVKDSLLVKSFNFTLGLIIGLIFYMVVL